MATYAANVACCFHLVQRHADRHDEDASRVTICFGVESPCSDKKARIFSRSFIVSSLVSSGSALRCYAGRGRSRVSTYLLLAAAFAFG